MTLAKTLRPLGPPAVFGYVANTITIVARSLFLAGPLSFITLTRPTFTITLTRFSVGGVRLPAE